MGSRRDYSFEENSTLFSVTLPPTNILLLTLLFLATLFFTSFVKADDKTQNKQYGPTKNGQTLWEIAVDAGKKAPYSGKSFAIEQLVSAIYSANPKAFRSANMNMLRTGAYLNLPSAETVANTPSKAAKKELSQHNHALNLLRVDAKQLLTAKRLKKKHQRHTRRLQKQLAKYRHKSKAWNKTYKKYVTSKRNESKSKRKIASLSALLLEKATLKSVKVVVVPIEKATRSSEPKEQLREEKKAEKTEISQVNNRLGQIQSSLENLNTSNQKLVNQVQQLATLDERVKVLEDELGKNDELVLQLKETLESAQESIEKQRLESKNLEDRLEELAKAQNTVKVEQPEKITLDAATVTNTEANESEIAVENTIENTEGTPTDTPIESKTEESVTTEEVAVEPIEEENETEAFANPTEAFPDIETIIKPKTDVTINTPLQISGEPEEDLLTPLIEEAETSLISTETQSQNKSNSTNSPADSEAVNTGLKSEEAIESKEQAPIENDQTKTTTSPNVEEQVLNKETIEGAQITKPITNKEAIQNSSELLETVQSYNPYILDMNPTENDQTSNSLKTKLDNTTEPANSVKSSFAPNSQDPAKSLKPQKETTAVAHQNNGRNALETQNAHELTSQNITNQALNGFRPVADNSWSGSLKAWLKDNIFILASILNGLMLIFVISGFFSKKELKAEIEEELEAKKQKQNNYVSWQDREKPKRSL